MEKDVYEVVGIDALPTNFASYIVQYMPPAGDIFVRKNESNSIDTIKYVFNYRDLEGLNAIESKLGQLGFAVRIDDFGLAITYSRKFTAISNSIVVSRSLRELEPEMTVVMYVK